MQDHTTNVVAVIRIASKYVIKRAFKLFDNETRLPSLRGIVFNLRLTSKDLNNSICDELSLEIMHRWMKGRDRCARVTKRIEQLLRNNNLKDLIKFMDAVANTFSKREAIRLLSSFLVTITQHHRHILKEYMDFFTSRNLHMTMQEYFLQRRDFPFPGFTPQQVEKSLQIANENGWIEESLLLYKHFLKIYLESDKDNGICEALSNGFKLNFGANLANTINVLNRGREPGDNRDDLTRPWLLSRYLRAKQVTTNHVTEILHNVSKKEAGQILVRSTINNKRYCTIVSFRGAQLVKYFYRLYDLKVRVVSRQIKPSAKTFTGLPPSPDHRQRLYLYQFYRAVVENDIEKAKQIHRENNIILEHLGHHPHPLAEYLRVLITGTISPMQEMIDFLVENFGVEECLKDLIFHAEAVARLWLIVKPLVHKGAKIYDILVWKKLFNESVPRSVRELRALIERSDISERLVTRVMNFLLDEFSRTSRGMISGTKMQLLLAWRYDSTCHLSKLPKDLLKVIVGFMNEPPLFIQYATIAIEGIKKTEFTCFPFSSETLERSGEIAKFFADNLSKIEYSPWYALSSYASERPVKRDAKYLRELFTTNDFWWAHDYVHPKKGPYFPQKVHRYYCKYETDDQVLKDLVKNNILSHYYKLYPLLEYAAVAKNMTLLNQFYSQPKNINKTLNEELYASVAPNRKNKMSYEEAAELVNQVRSKHLKLDQS